MNLFRRFLDRRHERKNVDSDQRKMTLQDADKNLLDAISDLETTIVMRRNGEQTVRIVRNEAERVADFLSFTAICTYRYSPPNSLMRLCKHEDHEAARLSIAPCQRMVCPFYREKK